MLPTASDSPSATSVSRYGFRGFLFVLLALFNVGTVLVLVSFSESFSVRSSAYLSVTPGSNATLSKSQGAIVNPSSLSLACRERSEWSSCRLSGENQTRFIYVGPVSCGSGVGHCFGMVGHIMKLAIRFHLQVVFRPQFSVAHGIGRVDDSFGLSTSPLLLQPGDPMLVGLKQVDLPKDMKAHVEFMSKHVEQTGVIYNVVDMEHSLNAEWMLPLKDFSPGEGDCSSPFPLLRNIFWSVPTRRYGCRRFLPPSPQPSWTIAIHIRRGDIAAAAYKSWQARNLPHQFYVETLRHVLQAIAKIEAGALINVLVFCEGRDGKIIDEHAKPVSWDIPKELCASLGLNCKQQNIINGNAMAALDCMVVADVFIGSRSGFSHLTGVLSSNVKVVPKMWHTYPQQDTMLVEPNEKDGKVSISIDVPELVDLIRNWRTCSAAAVALGNPFVHSSLTSSSHDFSLRHSHDIFHYFSNPSSLYTHSD